MTIFLCLFSEPYFKEDTTMNDTFMKEKPVFGLVLSMSLPMVLSMMVNALYNIVDSYFVARISEDAMTCLLYTSPRPRDS